MSNEILLYDLGRIAYTCWQQIPSHFTNVEVEPFVIMPNHVHGIITILDDDRIVPIHRRGTEFPEDDSIAFIHRRGTIYRAPTMDGEASTLEELGGTEYLDDDRSGTVHRKGTISGLRQQDRAHTMDGEAATLEEFGKPVPGSLATIIRTYKAAVSRIARKELGMADIWQRNYYEHIVRNQMELEMIGKYILANPNQWTDDPENVPHSKL